MNKLKELAKRNYDSIDLVLNEHRSVYENASTYYKDATRSLSPDVIGEIDYTKDIWTLQVYPRTPVVHYLGISNDLDALIEWGLDLPK